MVVGRAEVGQSGATDVRGGRGVAVTPVNPDSSDDLTVACIKQVLSGKFWCPV